MNRTQRAKIRALRNAQDLAKQRVNKDILVYGRSYQYLKCDSKSEKIVRNEVRDYKIAVRNLRKEMTTV